MDRETLNGPGPGLATTTGLHPYAWEDEEAPTGVFVGNAEPALLDLPAGAMLLRAPAGMLVEQASEAVVALLDRASAMLAAQQEQDAPQRIALDALSVEEVRQLTDILGTGEVAGVAGAAPEYQIAETILPGLWRIRAEEAGGKPAQDWLEVADIPSPVRAAARHFTRAMLTVPEAAPEGAMNVMPLLAEIASGMESAASGAPNTVINFTLLPMTPVDAAFLTRTLGSAPLKLASSGYGACIVRATGHARVWAVQYTNASGQIILDTLEIGDVPEGVRAGRHDFEDSGARLKTILEAYRP